MFAAAGIWRKNMATAVHGMGSKMVAGAGHAAARVRDDFVGPIYSKMAKGLHAAAVWLDELPTAVHDMGSTMAADMGHVETMKQISKDQGTQLLSTSFF